MFINFITLQKKILNSTVIVHYAASEGCLTYLERGDLSGSTAMQYPSIAIHVTALAPCC